MGDGNFQPLQNRHPLTDRQKIATGDYVCEPYSVPNLAHIRPWGFLGKWVKYNRGKNHFFYLA